MLEEVSFILPALNESTNIGPVIDSIRKGMRNGLSHEIVVVDNGSTDETVIIATDRGAKVLCCPGIPISGVRNRGAYCSTGSILVFLDADVLLTPQWGQEISKVIQELQRDPMTVTGFTCGISDESVWLEKNWFDPALRRRAPCYVNSGHLITTRILFDKVGGFNECLETGEDVDFCERAKSHGARIVLNPMLSVVHMGFPKTLLTFFYRERWHARGDYYSWKKLKSSKPALISLFFVLMFTPIVLISILIWKLWPLGLYAGVFAGVCLASSLDRFGITNPRWISGGLIYAVYFAARGFSFIDIIKEQSDRVW